MANVYEFINDRNLERGFRSFLSIKEGIPNVIGQKDNARKLVCESCLIVKL